jgi:thiamine transport system permease protein
MTLAIFRLLGRPGDLNLNAALGMSVALIGITAAAIVLIERLRAPGVGGF